MKLTERDVDLLTALFKFRYLSVSQVEELLFPSKRTAYRRLAALTDFSMIKSFTAPSIPESIYYLDRQGAEIVASQMQVSLSELAWHRSMKVPKDYYFLRHFLAVNDFRIMVTKACEGTDIRLLGFIPEYIGEKTPQGNVKKYIRDRVCDITDARREYSHTPDGVFALRKGANDALFFVEIDRGTEIVSDPDKGVLKSIVFYLNYWVSGKFARYSKDFETEFKAFRTLVVTTSSERLKNIRLAARRLPFENPHAKRFIWGTERISIHSFFDPVWKSFDATDDAIYKIG